MPGEVWKPVQFGNYVLVSQLGRGGMAEVYKARAVGVHGFQKTLCIKRILHHHTHDKHFLEMFVNEAKISARLSHPNIVQVYELGEVEGEFFMAMEFVHGRDLLNVMRTVAPHGPPRFAFGAYVAREMARALAHAHDLRDDQGRSTPVIHRDVSPQNVMLSYDGIVKLVDFGIAKAAQQHGADETRTGALKGKFAYMAPEQLDGAKATPQSDLFAVGVTLFEMLTAKRLFKGNTDYDTLVRVKSQILEPPSVSNPAVPPELDQIVMTALQRDPTRRYQRASQLARDLDLFCGQAGFTVEDMKEFMAHAFPKREEVPDGVIALPVPGSLGSYGGPRAPTVSQTGAKRLEVSVGPTSVTPSRVAAVRPKARGLWLGLAALALVVVGGAALAALNLAGRRATPALSSAAAPIVDGKPADEVVQLVSNPPGAEVLDGPRLLGTTPVTLKIGESRPVITVRLNKPGFEELVYGVSASDAPTVTLKLTPRKHHAAPAAKPAAPAPPPRELNVKSFDDEDPSAPKVKPIDE